jgi:hypothetical protein
MTNATTMSNDPEAIRRLTHSYRYLRGYAQIPLALALLGSRSTSAMGFAWAPVVFIVLFALAIPAMRAIDRYYDRRFGVVKARGWGAGAWAIAIATFFVLQFVSVGFGLPVQLGFFGAGIACAVYALCHFELEKQRLLLAVFLVAVSVWPLSFFGQSDEPWSESGELWNNTMAFGFIAVWIVMALFDHRALVKAFERTQVAETDGAPSSIR